MDASETLAGEYSAKSVAYARLWSPVIRPMALPDCFRRLPLRNSAPESWTREPGRAPCSRISTAAAPDAMVHRHRPIRGNAARGAGSRGTSPSRWWGTPNSWASARAPIDVAVSDLPCCCTCPIRRRVCARSTGCCGPAGAWGWSRGGRDLVNPGIDDLGSRNSTGRAPTRTRAIPVSCSKRRWIPPRNWSIFYLPPDSSSVKMWSARVAHQWTPDDLLAMQSELRDAGAATVEPLARTAEAVPGACARAG